AVIEESAECDAPGLAQLEQTRSGSLAIRDATADDHRLQSGIERRYVQWLQKLIEDTRRRADEQSRAIELVVGEQRIERRAVRDTIEDVRVLAVRLGPAGHDLALTAQLVELSQVRGPVR